MPRNPSPDDWPTPYRRPRVCTICRRTIEANQVRYITITDVGDEHYSHATCEQQKQALH